MPKVLIFAGANGSGKTTLAATVVEPASQFINADSIRDTEGLSFIDAGKKALVAIDGCILRNESFSFETTMSGLGLLKRFKRLKGKGYDITMFYLFAYPVRLLEERVKERVKKGGHEVPAKDIKRRYYRSVNNFWNMYRKFADEWAIVHNNEFQYKNIVIGNKEAFHVIDEGEFIKFKEVLIHEK